VVFESAGAAVGCCVAGQRALAGHDWPDGGLDFKGGTALIDAGYRYAADALAESGLGWP